VRTPEQRVEAVRLYGEKSVAEGETPYTHEDLARDVDNSCDHGSSAIRTDRIAATIEELSRLKAERSEVFAETLRFCDLIKRAEWGAENFCPWCNARAEMQDDGSLYGEHMRDWPAFNAPGSLR
jgi:hypothetical protein